MPKRSGRLKQDISKSEGGRLCSHEATTVTGISLGRGDACLSTGWASGLILRWCESSTNYLIHILSVRTCSVEVK